MATDAQSLLTAAACYDCGADAGQWQLYKLGLLKLIAQSINPNVATDPNSLMAQAACYQCLTPGMQMLAELALLAQIATGGGATVITGTFATPNGNVNGSKGQIYVDTNLQSLWVQENPSRGNTGWVQYV